MASELRPPASDAEKIAVLRASGGPFDFAVALCVDWDEVANDLARRQMVGSVGPDHLHPIENLAVVALAYYAPHRLGIDVDELDTSIVDAEVIDDEEDSP